MNSAMVNTADMHTSDANSILIVDDNPRNLQVLGWLLQGNLFETEFATSGESSLAWLGKRKFDLVLLDINMPGMDGFEVCRKIKSDPELSRIPVLFLSADNDRESILKGFENGGQDYVTKPFDSRELLARVRTHIRLKESLEELENINRMLEHKVDERTRQLRTANMQLEESNRKLLDLDRSKADFLKLISHEIRTPLNGIRCPLELMKMNGGTSEITELLDILDTSVQRLERFSVNALLITRLKTIRNNIRRDLIDLGSVARDLLVSSPGLMNKPVKINISGIGENLFIEGERELVSQCLENLIENACRFSPDNGSIDVSIYRENDRVCCDIRDQGPGFPTELPGDLFDLFNVGTEFKDGYAGMGLAIAKMVMDAHKGEINIENGPSEGAVVKLKFRPAPPSGEN